MKITYTLTPENMKEAGAIAYQTRVLKKKVILLAALLGLMLYILRAWNDPGLILFFTLVFGGLLLLNASSTSDGALQLKSATIPHTLEANQEHLKITTENTDGTVKRNHFLPLTERP